MPVRNILFVMADQLRADCWGAGLGLSVVARLVEILGGEVHVESRLEGGAAFRVLLPLTLPEGRHQGEAWAASLARPGA